MMKGMKNRVKERADDKYVWRYDCPIGALDIACDELGITDISVSAVDGIRQATELTDRCATQLAEYFNGTRTGFDLPLSPRGTDFQQKVWNALLTIPYGETRSYKDIAVQIGNPKATRAVGMANNRNRIMIVIPCHRVIGADGSLVGYGCGLDIKEKLLKIEGVIN